MKKFNTQVEDHYFQENLYERILEGLKRKNLDLGRIQRSDLAGVDEFHVRGAEVSQKMAQYAKIDGHRVLDVGCGIGGPARMLRAVYNCEVTGIDINQEYIETARKLTRLVGIKEGITFIRADANDLPFDNQSFDLVWTQHVQMNIRDKERLYAEIVRVLRKGGQFIYYEILSKGDGKISYPVPWANDESISFLTKKEPLETILTEAGLKRVKVEDETGQGMEFFEKLLARIAEKGAPEVGLNLLMGPSTGVKITNLLEGLKSGSLELQSGLYTK